MEDQKISNPKSFLLNKTLEDAAQGQRLPSVVLISGLGVFTEPDLVKEAPVHNLKLKQLMGKQGESAACSQKPLPQRLSSSQSLFQFS